LLPKDCHPKTTPRERVLLERPDITIYKETYRQNNLEPAVITQASKAIPDIEYAENDGMNILRKGWYEPLLKQKNSEEKSEASSSDGSVDENGLLLKSKKKMTKELLHILTLSAMEEDQKDILFKAGFIGIGDILDMQSEDFSKSLRKLGLKRVNFDALKNFHLYACNQVNISQEMPNVLNINAGDWSSIQRQTYVKEDEQGTMTEIPLVVGMVGELSKDYREFMNKISVQLPPLLLFFYMGDDIFYDETGTLHNPEWCPLAQLWVNHRDPDADKRFDGIKSSLFLVEESKYDFLEEYSVVPYIRNYPKDIQSWNSNTVRPILHIEAALEGKPTGKSIEDSLELCYKLFYFASHAEHDTIYLEDDTAPQNKPYQVFARANVHLTKKYGDFGQVTDILKFHDDLCNHLFEDIPIGFFYNVKSGEARGMKHSEDMEQILVSKLDLQPFNDLMRRTLFLFKTAFGIDFGLLDGGQRCMSIKTALFNMSLSRQKRYITEETERTYMTDGGDFQLKKVAALAPVAIVWPSWETNLNHKVYNWKVRGAKNGICEFSDFRSVYPEIGVRFPDYPSGNRNYQHTIYKL
jgi:hypothetical protein